MELIIHLLIKRSVMVIELNRMVICLLLMMERRVFMYVVFEM